VAAKTNAVRILDQARVSYELLEYSLSDDEFSAVAVADQLGMAQDQIFKTLVAIGIPSGPVFAVVPAVAKLDLKRLAGQRQQQRMILAPASDLFRLTGYRRGAVTVLGARRAFPAIIGDLATAHEYIAVSAGGPGLQVLVRTTDYLWVTGATVADISR